MNVSELNFGVEREVLLSSKSMCYFGPPHDMMVSQTRDGRRLRVLFVSKPNDRISDLSVYESRFKSNGFHKCQVIKAEMGQNCNPNNSLLKLNRKTFLWTDIGRSHVVVRGWDIGDYRVLYRKFKRFGILSEVLDSMLNILKLIRVSDDLFAVMYCQCSTEARDYRIRRSGWVQRSKEYRDDMSRGYYFRSQKFLLFSYESASLVKEIPYLSERIHNDSLVIPSKKHENAVYMYSGGFPIHKREIVCYDLMNLKYIGKRYYPIRLNLQSTSCNIVCMDTFINSWNDETLVFLSGDRNVNFLTFGTTLARSVKLTTQFNMSYFTSFSIFSNRVGFIGTNDGRIIYFSLENFQSDRKNGKIPKSVEKSDIDHGEKLMERGVGHVVEYLYFGIDDSEKLVLTTVLKNDETNIWEGSVKFVQIDNILKISVGVNEVADLKDRVNFVQSGMEEGVFSKICFMGDVDNSQLFVPKSFLND